MDWFCGLNLDAILPDGAQRIGAGVLFSEDLALPVGAGRGGILAAPVAG